MNIILTRNDTLQLFQDYHRELMSKKDECNFVIMSHGIVISTQKVINIVVGYFINCVRVCCFFYEGIKVTFAKYVRLFNPQ